LHFFRVRPDPRRLLQATCLPLFIPQSWSEAHSVREQ
jgi:hypothetical protein